MSAIYHACPEREWFASFEKLDGGSVLFSGSHSCHMEGIYTVRIKLTNGIVTKLKDVRYVSQLKKNVILIGSLEAQSLNGTLREGVLKMFSGLLVILKGHSVQ